MRLVAAARSLDTLNTLAAAVLAVGGPALVLLAADLAQDGKAERLVADAPAVTGHVGVLVGYWLSP